MHSGQGSYLEFTVPFIVDVSGYTTKVNGQMMHLDATTSLKFRSLLQCETLEVCSEHCQTCSGELISFCKIGVYASCDIGHCGVVGTVLLYYPSLGHGEMAHVAMDVRVALFDWSLFISWMNEL